MSENSTTSDPYEIVLADLRAKRAQIDAAIAAIEATRSGVAVAGGASSGGPSGGMPEAPAEGPGAFLGMSISEAAKKLLATRRQPLRNPDIAAALMAGGLHMNSADPVNTIGSVLTRRAETHGDIVRVGRGTWGLKEWYPGRSFKKDRGATDDGKSNGGAES